jgi:two-component system response regulator WspF
MPFRVAIVNDLAMAREALRRVVLPIPDTEVAWIANDGAEALAKAKADRPDLILMDLIMPVMDGVEATRRIMREAPCPIVAVTATVEGNASRVYEAIGAGALDAVDTPQLGSGGARGDRALVGKIASVRRMRDAERMPVPKASAGKSPGPAARAAQAAGPCPLVAVGASTGGPQALATFLKGLSADAGACVLVVQHMDPAFLPGLADWLAAESGRDVRLAARGEAPAAGRVLIAGEELQMTLGADGRIAYSEGDPNAIHRPSVDALFAGLAAAGCAPGVAVLLTGMGKDGAAGMLALRQAGWRTLAQDEATSVVWGMPGAATAVGAAERTLPVGDLGAAAAEALRAIRAGGPR